LENDVIEWKLFWTLAATAVSLALAVFTVTGVLWALLTTILAAAMGIVAGLLGFVIVEACEMWRHAEDWQRKHVWLGIQAAAAAFTAWTITAVHLPRTALNFTIMAGILAALAVGVYWSARGLEYRLLKLRPPAHARSETDPDELLGHREKILAAALRQAGLGFVRVLPGSEPLRSNAGWQFRGRTQSKTRLRGDARAGAQVELTSRHMEALAIALAEITGRDVESSWVRCRKERQAGTYSFTITNRDLMAEVIPYVDDPTPTSITTPALVGIEIDGREHRERLDQHGRNIGSSTSGKTSLINLELAHATRSTDALVWVAGVQKLYDLVGPWLEPYYNTGLRPPLNWVANGQTDTLTMMAAAMELARWRQRQPMNQRRWRTILLFLDEFSFTAQSRQKVMFQGEWVDASWLASGMLRGAASANIYVRMATQRSTIDHFGDKGGDVIANIAVNNAFRSKDWAEIGRMTNDYKLPVPQWPGEYYLLSNSDPLNLKAPYIQTPDPSKPRLHDGATIADVAWSRRHLVGADLAESEGLAALGAAYANRNQLVNDQMMRYLTRGSGEAPTEESTDATEHGEVYDAIRAQLAAAAAEAGLDLSQDDAPPAPEPERRRPAAILALLEAAKDTHPDGMGAAQIADALKENGDAAAEPGVLAPTLSRMHSQGKIARVASGRYAALRHTTA
jgi:hypothetical protein